MSVEDMERRVVDLDRTWEKVIHGIPTNPRRETFIQPELIPPVHCYQVTEPLMSQL
jgi:hypothetical protein